ncbi:MAG: formate--tetrahydrofolate ligase, partial [Porphyromonas sp.]|nr:formate--tetrahydrofolate ligase [Porphyromonas sp.]
NMISALLDNYIYQNRNTEKALKQVAWKRVLDVNDRSLRTVVTGLGGINNGIPAETGFDITPASEVMAILCLAKDLKDLRRRIENIILGYLNDGTPFTVKDLGVAGAITVLLKDAFNPNIVQTIEQTPALIHGGPFANIAHGCNSLVATKTALQYGDYVVTEAGFGADLGGEKFFDIKCRMGELEPALTVLVATVQAIKLHAGVPQTDLKTENVPALEEGFCNLDRHVENLLKFGQSVCVCINRFPTDTDDEIKAVADYCEKKGVSFAINEAFAKGGEGAVALAKEVVRMVEESPSQPLKYVYEPEDSIRTKVEKISHEIYRANMVEFSGRATKMIKRIEELGYSHFPVCIAKTQYSFTDNAKLYGAPTDFDLKVTDVVLNAGAEMIVVLMGDVMRMPGLPKAPSANQIDIVKGQIEGLS